VTFDEGERGSLEAGKVADMCILSENPYEMAPEDLGRLKVEGLILAGKPYEAQRQSVASAVVKGMLGGGRV